MKRALVMLLLTLFLVSVSPLFSQQQEEKFFYKTVPIAKILSHPDGYKVIYRKASMEFDTFYVPYSWFKAGGKGEVVFGSDQAFPYCSIFFRDGKFDFIRLYVQENLDHPTWGVVKAKAAERERFQVEELILEY